MLCQRTNSLIKYEMTSSLKLSILSRKLESFQKSNCGQKLLKDGKQERSYIPLFYNFLLGFRLYKTRDQTNEDSRQPYTITTCQNIISS